MENVTKQILENPSLDALGHEDKLRLDFFLSNVKLKGKKILDDGCGPGISSAYLIDKLKNCELYAIDVNDELIKTARRLNIKAKVASGENLPFKNKQLDIVLSIEVLEHVENPDKYLGEASRVLKKNGILMLSTPNNKIFSGGFQSFNPEHINEMNFDQLNKLLDPHFKDLQIHAMRYENLEDEKTQHQKLRRANQIRTLKTVAKSIQLPIFLLKKKKKSANKPESQDKYIIDDKLEHAKWFIVIGVKK